MWMDLVGQGKVKGKWKERETDMRTVDWDCGERKDKRTN